MSAAPITPCPHCGNASSEDYDGRGICWGCLNRRQAVAVEPVGEVVAGPFWRAREQAAAPTPAAHPEPIPPPPRAPTAAVPAASVGRNVIARDLAEYRPTAVDWLWRKRIPAGELTVLGGDGGLGKSTFLAHLAALITRGEVSGLNGTGRVLVVLGEDDPARVVAARYRAAGADLSKVSIIAAHEAGADEVPILPDDLPLIRATVEQLRPDLVAIDPIAAHLSAQTDAHRDGGRGGLRSVLTPLSRLAQATGATVIAVAHYNKGTGPASQRLSGSVAMRNGPRSVLVFARHPDARGEDDGEDDGRRIIGHEKCNLGAEQPSLAATLRSVPVLKSDGTPLLDKDGDAATTSVLDVGGVSTVGYEDALAAASLGRRDDDSEHDALAEAEDFICAELADGPIPSRALDRAAADAGIAKRTIERARRRLGVKAVKTADGWVVSLTGDGLGGLDAEGVQTSMASGDSNTANNTANTGKTAKAATDATPHAMASLPLNALMADCDDGARA